MKYLDGREVRLGDIVAWEETEVLSLVQSIPANITLFIREHSGVISTVGF
jgi:hypothetical protein